MKMKLLEKKTISLRTKWTVVMSVFIFTTFVMFAFLFYHNTSNLLMREGSNRIHDTIADLDERLSKSDHNLTAQKTSELLTESLTISTNGNQPDNKDKDMVKHNATVDALVSELAQHEVYTYVYNKQQKLIFQTQPRQKNMSVTPIDQKMTFHRVHGVMGYTCGKKVISKETGEVVGYIQIFYELTNLYKIRRNIISNLLFFLFVWCMLVCLFAYALSRYFIRPLQKMTETIEDIRKDPLTANRTEEPKSHDEVWMLMRLFNGMMDKMQEYIAQQEQFVSDVSHELRTPVAIIEGHLKLLDRWGKEDPDVLEESLTASLQEIERMKNLVQEMLELSRVEQTELQHRNDSANAEEVVTQVVENFRMLHPNFTFIFDDDLRHEIPIAMYRNHLEQLLIIILDNAVKYSTEEKRIVHVSLSSNPHMVEFAIQDFGEGIAQEDLEHIFDRFYRVDKARSREKGGNGLGLSIAQKLIAIYRGTLSVESALGQGTIFHIEIPIYRQDED